jgi:hypothetical protein
MLISFDPGAVPHFGFPASRHARLVGFVCKPIVHAQRRFDPDQKRRPPKGCRHVTLLLVFGALYSNSAGFIRRTIREPKW